VCVCVWEPSPPRRGMSGRTECGKPSVTIAHRGIFTPTLALSRNPSIPILHTSRRLITVTSQRTLSSFKTMPELPGARTLTILLGAVCFLLHGKSLGRCQWNAAPLARRPRIPDNRRVLVLLRLQRAITEYISKNLFRTRKSYLNSLQIYIW